MYKKISTILTFLLLSWFCSTRLLAQPNIILGRPTDTSITVSLLHPDIIQFYIEYGTNTGIYPNNTSTLINSPNIPIEFDIHNLLPNTAYYYRLRFKPTNSSAYASTPEYSFHTQRATGSEFSFTIEADEHLYDKKGVASLYTICLNNQLSDKSDFMLSLGDIFGDDHNPNTITLNDLDSLHKYYRPFLGNICHSVPFYVCLGNHEGENDYYFNQNNGSNLCVWGTQTRLKYFPNPFPNSFYSGNTETEPFNIGYPENYYAWHWGDALFVVLDVYRYQNDTSAKPQKWDWTIGQTQYTWLKNTLENSQATFKFVFAHHIRGQGRGGITNAKWYEWGGYDGGSGTNYGFTNQRAGWAKPIHQLFVDEGVNIFFQGHDHVFAHEILDGVTYQSLPMPSDSTYEIGMLANADAYTADTLNGSGHIKVTVNSNCATVDYIRAYLPADTVSGVHHNKEVAFTYSVGNCLPASNHVIKQTEDLVRIYPNPSSEYITVDMPANLIGATISIIDMIGHQVMNTKQQHIQIEQLPKGIYIVEIKKDNQIINKKITLQ